MYNTNIYISKPNWGLHPLLFYFWLFRHCFFLFCFFFFLPFWYNHPFLFSLSWYLTFSFTYQPFAPIKSPQFGFLSLIEFYSGQLIFMFCSCFLGADHAKSPCLTLMQAGPKHLYFLKFLTCILIAGMFKDLCPKIFYNSTNSELKWIMHTCWASQVAP